MEAEGGEGGGRGREGTWLFVLRVRVHARVCVYVCVYTWTRIDACIVVMDAHVRGSPVPCPLLSYLADLIHRHPPN